MKHPLGSTQNGVEVYIDLIRSKAAAHISRQPHLLGLVEEVVRQATLEGAEVTIEQNMGRPIGYSFVIPTASADTIFYAQLVKETIYTRFVKNGKPQETYYFTLLLRRDDSDNSYAVEDTWIGRVNPPRPGSSNETPESRSYWDNHAFVLDNQQIQLKTITKICPY